MSTTTGFLCGVISAAILTACYGEPLSAFVRDSLSAQIATESAIATTRSTVAENPASPAPAFGSLQVTAGEQLPVTVPEQPVSSGTPANQAAETADSAPDLVTLWQRYADRAATLRPQGEFPWRACFQRAAASYALPEALLLALARAESNFDPAARSDSEAVGIMQIRWPTTARHLGIRREADLYDPCTNVDAGARYIGELLTRYDNNHYLAVAAYNYGPSRITESSVPEGARWYSAYVYGHLQAVIGSDDAGTAELLSRPENPAGSLVLMSFSQAYRARAFLQHLLGKLPHLRLALESEQLGRHHVVLVYSDGEERQRALDQIDDAGIATLAPTRSTMTL